MTRWAGLKWFGYLPERGGSIFWHVAFGTAFAAEPVVRPGDHVLIAGDAWVRNAPDPKAPGAWLGAWDYENDRVDGARYARIDAVDGERVQFQFEDIRTLTHGGTCRFPPSVIKTIPLSLWVRTSDLLRITPDRLTLELGAIELSGGLPVEVLPSGHVAVMDGRWRFTTSLPTSDFGYVWNPSAHPESEATTTTWGLAVPSAFVVGQTNVELWRGFTETIGGSRVPVVGVPISPPGESRTLDTGCALIHTGSVPPESPRWAELQDEVLGGIIGGGVYSEISTLAKGSLVSWPESGGLPTPSLSRTQQPRSG